MPTILKADQTNEVIYSLDCDTGAHIEVVVNKITNPLTYSFFVTVPDTSADYMLWSNWLSNVEGSNPLEIVGSLPLPGGGTVESGVIVMWSGLLVTIPSGWVLCDGTNGTPDLRDKFIKGAAASANPGATGGSSTHTHSDHTGIINHTHPITDPGHTHTTQRYPTATGSNSGFTIDTSMSGTLADNTLPVKSNTTGITVNNPAGGVSAYTHNTVNHEPVYYALAFIMKT